jgi:hypothetical protein
MKADSPHPTAGAPWLDLVRRYYDGCSAGDIALVAATLHPEVVHFFLAPNQGSAPVRGAQHLARYWRKVQGMIDARWVVDHICASGGQAVIEWTMFWRPAGQFMHRWSARARPRCCWRWGGGGAPERLIR